MDPAEQALWQQADALLDGLLDLPVDARAAALAALEVPEALRERVRRLLQAHAHDGVLDHAPLLPATGGDDLCGRVLGRWRLVERIGEGGMAVVYRAVSVAPPLDQVAAVKILALGSLARDPRGQALQREQALLARLRHPFIAPFHEAGLAVDGTPWLAMGLVEGERIDAWCERTGADVRARVRLLLDVADAVAHAHRNLVVHRDIKPSNVLVDDGGHVRLLDFGIGQLLDAGGERTATLHRALTPDYAAPEQFAGGLPSTAIDVYGLGALLYRLLTGQPPASPATAGTPTQPPSQRPAGQGAEGPRRDGPDRQVRGDLDTIVMKALAARPQDRYGSVDALAEDLRRWLDRRPILARGPGAGYRLRLFVRRHRLAVGAAAALLLALAAGLAGTAWQARRATAQAALAEAAAERSRAQLLYVDALLEDIVAPSTPAAMRRDTGALIQVAAERAAQALATQPDVLAGVETTLASVADRAGHAALARRLAESAHARLSVWPAASAEARAQAMTLLATQLYRGEPAQPDRARALASAADALLRSQAPASKARIPALIQLAIQHADDDAVDAAATLLETGRALCAGLPADEPECDRLLLTHGSLLFRTGRFAAAGELLQQLVDLRRQRLGEDHVSTLSARYLLAMNHLRAGQPRQAQPMLEAVLAQQREAYGRPTRETLLSLRALVEAAIINSDLGRARSLAEQVLADIGQVEGDTAPDLAMGWSQLGSIAFMDGDFVAAGQAYAESRRRYDALYGDDSLASLIMAGNEADAMRERGEVTEALVLQRRVLDAMEARFPDQPLRIAPRLTNTARTLVRAGRPSEALPLYARATALYREHTPAGSNHHVSAAYHAEALRAAGRIDEARTMLRDAIAGLREALGSEHRYVWEALALRVAAECTAPAAPGCAAAAGDARAALRHPALPGQAAAMLRQALSAGEGRH